MGLKENLKKSSSTAPSRSGTPTASKFKPGIAASVTGTPEKAGPSKKGRKRKNPLPDDAPPSSSQGPGRPKKKKEDTLTPSQEPSTPVGKSKNKKLTKKNTDGDPDTPSGVSSPKPGKEKKLTKKQLATAAKAAEKPVKPKKKYQKLTQEEREARRLQKKQATEEARKLKQQKSKQISKAKERPPVDVEKQCGVPLENGGFCARSLTCKTHSMGAKRAVPGRSKPYDILLAAYQKRNQVKLAELSTQQQLEKENEEFSGAQPLTEEEEISLVMSGVFESKPVPLERRVLIPVRQKTKYLKMREMLITALNKTPPMSTFVSLSQPNSSNPSAGPSGAQIPGLNGQNPNTAASAAASKDGNGSSDSNNPNSPGSQAYNGRHPAPPIPHNIGKIMSNTSSLYGRSLVFDSSSGQTFTRPSQTLFANRVLKHHNALRQRRYQQMQLEQQQQMQAARAQSQAQGVPMQAQGSMLGQIPNQQQPMSRSPSNPGFPSGAPGMQHMVSNNGFQQK